MFLILFLSSVIPTFIKKHLTSPMFTVEMILELETLPFHGFPSCLLALSIVITTVFSETYTHSKICSGSVKPFKLYVLQF